MQSSGQRVWRSWVNVPEIEAAIDELKKRIAHLKGVKAAILFGSAARGTATEYSDVDILMVTPRENEQAVLEEIWAIERDLPVRISPLFADGDFEGFDAHLLESLFRDGKVLVGDFPPLTVEDLGLEPMKLVKYRMEGLSPAEKMRVYRFLDGYKTTRRRGDKEYVYHQKGFLEDVGGWRLGRGAVIVPEAAANRLDEYFRHHGVKRIMVAVWVPRP